MIELVDELTRHVEEYIKMLKPPDAHEWQVVLQEITSFLQADSIIIQASSVHPTNPEWDEPNYFPVRLDPSLRILNAHTPYPFSGPSVTLQEVILVGNHMCRRRFGCRTMEVVGVVLALNCGVSRWWLCTYRGR